MGDNCKSDADVPVAMTGLKTRKKYSTKKCFCEISPTRKRKKNSIDLYLQQSRLLHSDVYKPKTDFKINDLELNAIKSKLVKPCTVNIIPINPMKCALYNAHITNDSSLKYLQIIENKKPFGLNNEEQNGSFMSKSTGTLKKRTKERSIKSTGPLKKRAKERSIKSTGALKKRTKERLIKSDLMKSLKSCSVVLEKSNLNNFSKDFKINIPMPHCHTGQVELKPCHIKLTKMNNIEARTSVSHSLDVLKPCIVKLEGIDTEILPAFNTCENENIGNLDVIASKEKLKIMSSSKDKSSDASLTLKKKRPSTHSSCEGKITTKYKTNSRNSFEEFLFKSIGDESDLSEVSENHPNDIDYSNSEEQSLTTGLKKSNDSAIEKCLEYDSNDIHSVKELQIVFQPFSSSSNLVTKSRKVFRRSSFEILEADTVSFLASNDLKSNASSGLKSAVKSYFKPIEETRVQCEMQSSENDMHYCYQCSKALPSLKSFYYHVCHGKQKRGYPCKFCEKNFDFFHALRKHKNSHSLRNSLSCSDTVKSRRNKNSEVASCCVLELRKKVQNAPSKAISVMIDKNMKKRLEGKENNSSPKLKSKKLKTKFFLRNASDATTSSGCYSSDLNFLQISNSDDSEVD